MKEFDFDELDRAVHAALGTKTSVDDTNGKPDLTSQPDIPAVRESETAPVPEPARESKHISSHAIHSRIMSPKQAVRERPDLQRHKKSVIDHDASTVETDTTPDQTHEVASKQNQDDAPFQKPVPTGPQPKPRSLARRRSGRFMDVVHPSSDMRTSVMGKPSPQSPKQQATSSTPSSTDEPEEVKADTPETVMHNNELAAAIDKLLVEDVAPSKPVEAVNDSPQASVPAPETLVPEAPDEITPEIEQSSTPEDDKKSTNDDNPTKSSETDETQAPQQTSPFVTDAQVQKRPLGGVPKDIAEEQVAAEPAVSDPAPIADDIHSKIRAIESIDSLDPVEDASYLATPTPETPSPEPTPTPAPKLETTPLETEAPKADDSTSKKSTAAAPAVSGPTSITRQYKETPRVASADDTSSIFDPENYHQPLESEPKKKISWGLVIFILVVLALGGSIAAFLWWSGLLVAPL